MRSLLHSLFSFVFPERNDAVIIRESSVEEILHCYWPQQYNDVVHLTSFNNILIRATVHEMKFYENEKAFLLAGALLEKYINDHVTEETFIIPIPLSSRRQRKRGYNQSERVAKQVTPKQPRLHLLPNVLIRTKHTQPQTSLSQSERHKNMRGVFAVSSYNISALAGRHIIVFDDVSTTGATFAEAKRVLLPHSPLSLTCLSLAH